MFLFDFTITSLMLISLAIFLLFRFTRFISDKMIKGDLVKHRLKRFLFGLEFVVWAAMVYQLAEKSLNMQPVLSVIMTLLLVFAISWTFWFVLKDYLAGLYIRMSGRFKLLETITFDSVQGKIIKFADLNLILELKNHTTIELPYAMFFNKKIERHLESTDEELILIFEFKSIKNRENFLQDIKKNILLLPWINHKLEPKLTILNQEKDKTNIELKLFLVDKKYRNRVEAVLTNNFVK